MYVAGSLSPGQAHRWAGSVTTTRPMSATHSTL